MLFQNLIKNGEFEEGKLDPWTGENACVISDPCPNMTGEFSVVLMSEDVDANIGQTLNVIPGESYNLGISLAANRRGISPPVEVILEFLNLSGQPVKEGIHIRIKEGQLPNGIRSSFKTIHQNSLRVPANTYFARLTIKKLASPCVTGVIVDHITFIRMEEDTSLPSAYVGNTGTNTVSVIGNNLDTITVGQGPVAMVQVIQNNAQYIYVGCEDGTVSVIEASNNTVVATIDLPGGLSWQENRNILANSDGSTVYVANQNSVTNQGYISVIDTSTNTLSTSISVDSNPITLALTNDGQPNSGLLYAINLGNHSISVIDTSTNTLSDHFSVKQADPTYLVITLDNQYFIIGYTSGSNFHVGDVSTNTIIKSVSYSDDRHARSLTLSLDGTLLYLGLRLGQDANHQGAIIHPYKIYDDFNELDEIVLNKQHQSDPLMVQQYELAEGYDMIYVGVAGSNERYIKQLMRQINTNVITIITSLPVSNFNGFFASSSDNQYIVTANPGGNSAAYIQTSSFSILETIAVETNPYVLLILENS